MSGLITTYEIPEPVRFKEKGCDLVFQVNVKFALYINEFDGTAFGATPNEQVANMKSMAAAKVEDCLAHWHEGDKILYIEGRDALENLLTVFLRENGVSGSARIDNLTLTDASEALYKEQIINPLNEKKAEQRKQEIEAAVEPHGPLRSVRYSLSSHGMMAGTGSSSGREIEWKNDGTVILKSTTSGNGRNTETEYKIEPDIAQKLIDFVEQEKIAAIAKLDIKKPLVYDCFTSSSITLIYDDRSVGGVPYKHVTLDCGPARMTFKSIEDKISDLLDEIEASGECIKSEMHETPGTVPGFMGMKQMMNMIDKNSEPKDEPPLVMMGLVPCDPDAGKRNQNPSEKWVCKCGQENTGKFCSECGEPKPAGWLCTCGHENTGKFCEECGKSESVAYEEGAWTCGSCGIAGNRGKYCAKCGCTKPQ